MKGLKLSMKTLKKVVIAVLVLAISLSLCAFGVSAEGGIVAWGAATVDASALNIRKGPGTGYDRVGIVAGGTIVVVLEKTNAQWYKINYSGTVGYVSVDYLTEILKAENFKATGVINGSGVRMRKGPSTGESIITSYDEGKEVHIIGINNGWYKVAEAEGTGYIRSDYVNITGGGPTYSTEKAANSTLGQQIANFALQYVGYNYVYGEESPSRGFDCSGLMYYVYGQFGYKLERRASMQYKYNGRHVSKSELQQGDLIFFSSNGGASVTHVGMYIGNGQFVHASTSKTGVIISDLNSSYYTRCYYGANRII